MKFNNQSILTKRNFKQVIKKTTAIFFIIAVFPLFSTAAYAENFSVRTKQPENQQNKAVSYFDLKTEPNQKQPLYITVENKDIKDITVDIQIDSATTSPLGFVDYSNKGRFSKDNSLKYDLKELLKVENSTYTLPKNSKTDIQLMLQMPEQEFAGILAGGIRISQSEAKQTATINNKVAYEIGIIIREKNTKLEKKFNYLKLNQTPNSLDLVFQNPVSTFINDLVLSTEIVALNQNKKVFSDKSKALQVAPNTKFPYPIPIPENLPAGKYQMNISANSEKGKWQWTFNDTFHISKQTKISRKTKTSQKKLNPFFMYSLLSSIVVMLLLTTVFILLRKQKQLKKEQLKLKKRKKKK